MTFREDAARKQAITGKKLSFYFDSHCFCRNRWRKVDLESWSRW